MSHKQIIRLDASCIKESACIRRLWLILQGYGSPKTAINLMYGSSFHKGVEEYALSGGDMQKAMYAASQYYNSHLADTEVTYSYKYLTLSHLMGGLQTYFKEAKSNPIFTKCKHLLTSDGKPIVEGKWSMPLYSDSDVDILLQGTIDGLYEVTNGCLAIGDWKTSSARDRKAYFASYKMSVQLRTYYYYLQWAAAQNPNSIIGEAFAKGKKIGCFIYGAFTSSDGVEFEQSPFIFFSERDMVKYKRLLNEVLGKVLESYRYPDHIPIEEGIINGACQTAYGSHCRYFGVCSAALNAPNEDQAQMVMRSMLNNHFTQRSYKPLEFGGKGNETTSTTNG